MRDYNNIREIIEDGSVKFKNNIAFKVKLAEKKYDDITYLRLREEIEALGKYLIKHNIGERIAVIGKNSYKWMLVYLAVLCSGKVIVPLDKGLFEYEIKDQLKRSKADFIFYADSFRDIMKDNERSLCMDDPEFDEILRLGKTYGDTEYKNIKIDSKKMSILIFTSGTTSKSKAVMLSQRNITSDVYGMSVWENFYETDVNMAILPFHHAFGMTQIVIFLSYGMCNVFCEGLRIDKCLKEYGVSIIVGVPRIVSEIRRTIIKKLTAMKKLDTVQRGIKLTSFLKKLHIDIRRRVFKEIIDGMGGKLRLIIVGAAAGDPDALEWFNNIGIVTVQGYGLTETSPCISAENETHIRRGSVGLPIPNVRVRISEPDENGIGEIAAKGENVMIGYLDDPDNTNKALKDGWFYTGDMGRIDKDGYLFITGRKKNVIVLGNGKNVFPEEIEQLLYESNAISECIVSCPAGTKEQLHAKIVYDAKNMTEDEAREAVSKHIADVNSRLISYKRIKSYEITDKEMEKTTTLKIKR